jgi:general stress protein CsbA
MMISRPGCRAVAVILVLALILTLAAPARAEADVLTTLAIVSLVVAGVVIIAYLVIANLHDRRAADAGPVLLACVDSDAAPRVCRPVSALPERGQHAEPPAPHGVPAPLLQAQ